MANHKRHGSSSFSDQVRELGQAINAGNMSAALSLRTLLSEEGMGYLHGGSLPRKDAHDLIQEVISNVTIRLFDGQAIQNPRAYFYACLRSELDRRQKSLKRRQAQLHIPWEELTHDLPAEDEVLPLEQQEDRLRQARFAQHLLRQVSAKCRKLLERIFWVEEDPNQPRDLHQVAADLNLSNLDSLKATKSRCIRQAREQFFDQYQQFTHG
jgi:hypothetical protein